WFGAKVDASVHPPRLLEVHPESPAYQAGLRKQDQLLALEGQTLRGIFDWIKGVANVPPDQELSLRVQRGEEEFTRSLKLPPEETFFNADLIQDLMGMRLQLVTPQLARHVGLDRIQGLLVADIVPEGPAYSSGIRPGCVLIECQDQPVEDILSLARQIHGMKRGSKIQLTVLVQRRFGRLATFGKATASLRLP
ncbi:MAG: PDZ domain-containing protein, partial [Verrucomicrobiota bacterium]|nr:PDZ domain-containing protein [Verrucomicrobiota bacterium]